ncbi:MAG: site-2 protease family protein [Microbacterium sp.]
MTVLAFVVGVAVLVVGLAVSIALHELGHLVPAKLFGVRVGQYMIGFGPTLFSRRKGETEYGVKAIPLGGYISMAGMYPPAEVAESADEVGEADAVPVGAPAEVAAAGREHARRTPGRFFATMMQDARASNEATLQGPDDDRVFYRLPVHKRIIVMLGGPVMNLVLAIVIFTILLTGIGVQTATATIASLSDCVPVSSTSSDCASSTTPAETAGLEAGDRIVSIDGTVVSTFADASAIIQASAGQRLTLVVERDDAELTLEITPVAIDGATTDDDGDTVTTQIGFIGIRPTTEYVREPIWSGTTTAFENVGAVAGVMVQLPAKVYDTAVSLFTGAERDPNGPLSVVGAGVIAGEAAASDAPILDRVEYILGLLGSLNIALFVFNLIPLLPLDGGHVVIALWDGAKRTWAKAFRRPPPKPVDSARLVPLTFVVVVVLIAMSAILIVADLVNPISLF